MNNLLLFPLSAKHIDLFYGEIFANRNGDCIEFLYGNLQHTRMNMRERAMDIERTAQTWNGSGRSGEISVEVRNAQTASVQIASS
jgi:hypothetical protein